jgi:TRAP-type uncharacterized transport system substrate-binding protein
MIRIALTASLIVVAIVLTACDNDPIKLRMVTPIAVMDREITEELSRLLGENSTISIELSDTAESDAAALDALLAGDADIALVSNYVPFRTGISTVMPLYPSVLHIGYSRDRDATSGSALIRGATVFAGAPGSASRQIFERIAARLDLAPGEFSYIDDVEQEPDVFVVFAPISPDRLEELPDFRLFSFGFPGDIGTGSFVDATALMNPQLEPFVIPVGIYDNAASDPVLTVASDMMLVTRDDMDDTVVYDLVQELLRLRPALAALKPGLFQRLTGDIDSNSSTFVLHPGLLAYTQRDAPSVYERYSGIAEVAVTLFVALISATIAGMRIYRMRQKDRIDVFYSDAIAIRDSVDDSSSRDEVAAAVQQLLDLQTSAIEMLVDERLAADESFRIFMALSNDILGRLEAGPGKDRALQ